MTNPIQLLPPILVGKKWSSLPIEESKLIRCVASIAACSSRELQMDIANSSSLFLFACHHYFDSEDVPCESLPKLADWFLSKGLGLLASTQPSQVSKIWIQSYLAIEFEIRQNGAGKKITKCLVELARCLPGIERSEAKRWVRQIVGIRRLSLPDGHSQRNSRLMGQLLEVADRLREFESEFARRLNDEKLAAMRQLAYGASHEINNPLANIATRAQSLLGGEENPERRRKLAVVFEQAMRAHEMISDMMLFAHPPRPQFKLTCVSKAVRQVANEMRRHARQRNARIIVRTYPGVPKIQLDPTQFSDAMKALIQNSLESFDSLDGSSRAKVVIRIWCEHDESVLVSVTDNGPGIDEHVGRHLFDPFFSGREAGRGLGFGLSKADTISRQHGGELVWNMHAKEGTEFRFCFPVRQNSGCRIDNAHAA